MTWWDPAEKSDTGPCPSWHPKYVPPDGNPWVPHVAGAAMAIVCIGAVLSVSSERRREKRHAGLEDNWTAGRVEQAI